MRMRWIVGIGALTAALAACSAGGSVNVGGASTSASGSGSSSGSALTVAISGEPDQLDPQKTSDYNSFEVLENVFDTLVEPNASLQMEPALATSWTTSTNQLTWTFTLRSTTWQDGTPFTSADVVYSYDRIIDQKLPNSYRFAAVKSVAADGAHKVVITLKQPTPDLLNDIGGFMGVAIVEKKNVASNQIAQDPVGTGPYRVVSWDHGLSITLAANPDYWGGAPKIKTIKYEFVSNPTVALQDLEGGEVQWTDNLPPQQVQSLQKSANGFTVKSIPSTDYWYMTLNEARKPYNDVRVRQAIAYALNRSAIVQAATFGNATVNETAIPKTSQWYYDYSPYDTNLSKAKSLLAQAGVKNLTMNMMVTSEYPQTVTAAQVIAAELQPLGITVKIQTLDFGAWLAQEEAGNFDSFILGWLGNLDPSDYYYAQQTTGGSFNFQKFSNPTVNKLLDQAQSTTGFAQRKSLYDQAATIIVDQASYIYLYNPDVIQAFSTDLHGYTARPDRAVRFNQAWLG
ncbi:MAG: ABC transporter substrate-binding protein [Solirubrobacteraceae bacterium]